ncbi:MAG: thioredoxin family protein [Hyphomicrobiaceae bacterium]|nr:thioredoxin family protein [Hyphomicrobiaceae bacterium]
MPDINRRRMFVVTAAILMAINVIATRPGLAFEGEAFDEKTFVEAQKAGRPIVIEVSAGWCPICQVQGKVLSNLRKQPDFAKVLLITVEYDLEKDVLKRFNVTKQSTLIAFKGAAETARSVGDSNAASIEKLVRSTL